MKATKIMKKTPATITRMATPKVSADVFTGTGGTENVTSKVSRQSEKVKIIVSSGLPVQSVDKNDVEEITCWLAQGA